MAYNLAEIRKSFGISQEELAERMGKNVSTISRWERSKSQEPILSPLVNVANRQYQYVKHIISDEHIKFVENSDQICGLFYGPQYMVMAISGKALKRYPLLHASYGFSAASYFRGEGKRIYNENYDLIVQALATPGSSAIVYVPQNSGIVMTEPMKVEFNFIGQQLVFITATVLDAIEARKYEKGVLEVTFG